jgi:phospholipase C
MPRRTAPALVALPALVVAVLLAGCGAVGPRLPATTAPSSAPASASPSPSASASASASAPIQHIVVILEENEPADHVLSDDDAPYLNQLAKTSAVAANYAAITNPSLPNYIALTSGTTAGITTDCGPHDCPADVPNLADSVENSGRTWRIYGEGMPQACADTSTGNYAVKHIPFLYYPSISQDAKRCADHVVPYQQLAKDLAANRLPDLVFITPDLCNDMHNCSIATGDLWLSNEVPKILDSNAFAEDSLLVVTFDEGTKNHNDVATVFAGPAAKAGVTSTKAYSHYSLLHTIESMWDLPPLTENDRDAPVMTDLLAQ